MLMLGVQKTFQIRLCSSLGRLSSLLVSRSQVLVFVYSIMFIRAAEGPAMADQAGGAHSGSAEQPGERS